MQPERAAAAQVLDQVLRRAQGHRDQHRRLSLAQRLLHELGGFLQRLIAGRKDVARMAVEGAHRQRPATKLLARLGSARGALSRAAQVAGVHQIEILGLAAKLRAAEDVTGWMRGQLE